MLLLASKQIAALVEIQTFKSSSNITDVTASLRQRLTLGVKYSYLGEPVLAGLISLRTLYVFTSSVFAYK